MRADIRDFSGPESLRHGTGTDVEPMGRGALIELPNRDGDGPEPSAGARRTKLFAMLADRGFRGVWIIGACVAGIRWIEILTVSVFVYTLTGSPFDVSLVVFLRLVPLVLFGTIIGGVATVVSHRTLLASGLAVLAVVRAGLGILVVFDLIGVSLILGGMFVAGVIDSGDYPVRRHLLAEFAGAERAAPALALDAATNLATMALGPIVGGFLLEVIGLQGAYFMSALLNGVGTLIALRLPFVPERRGARGSGFLANLAEGVRYVRAHRLIVGTLAITVIFNFFGWPFTAMIPVIGREHLGLNAGLIGVLMSAHGLGAFIASLAIAAWQTSRLPRVYYFGTVIFFVAALMFPASLWFGASFVILFAAGLGLAGFASSQAAIVFLNAPEALRARALGLLAMCVGIGPFGALQIGLIADWIGARAAIAVIASAGLVALGAVYIFWPEFHHKSPIARKEAPTHASRRD